MGSSCAATMPERFASATPDKSIPPLPDTIESMMPSASRPSSGNWPPMDWRLSISTNWPCDNAVATNTTSTFTATRKFSCRSASHFDVFIERSSVQE